MNRESDQETVPGASPSDPSRTRGSGWLLATWEGGAVQRELPEHGQLVLGRGDDCDIVIPHPSVSRRHGRLHLGYPLRIEDLGSANGTRANGRKLAAGEVTVVDPQASLQLGDVTLLVRPSARESLLPPSPASERRTGLLASELAKVERARIVEALERCAGNQSRAAKELGISRRTLVGKLTEHALPRPLKKL